VYKVMELKLGCYMPCSIVTVCYQRVQGLRSVALLCRHQSAVTESGNAFCELAHPKNVVPGPD
jgi:hypothetical protein